jgi:iron complex transport system ATP-binding protein
VHRALIEIEGVSFGYWAGEPVLRSVSASLPAGRPTVLLGPNASGKTTLLRLLLGQLKPDAGCVRVGAEEVTRIPVERRATVLALVPQRGELASAYRVREVVEMGRLSQTRSPAAVDHAMYLCGLRPLAQRLHRDLSAGQQQRVLLARALAQLMDPDTLRARPSTALLLDEPASAMDPRHAYETMALLSRWCRESPGAAVLAVIHDLNLAAALAERAWLLDAGRLVAEGEWNEAASPARLSELLGLPVQLISTERSPASAAIPQRCYSVGPASSGPGPSHEVITP